ncbi:PREDICTED: protein Churchill-like [Branchiostoma belcheri]|uniref:Protein Churchill n=1 Tax=Branchiostoma belcheri TaxID=7741 RepID=A0A6P5AKZ4_BRABE|nr:PREDICTED: protein Churchill-like [Branchiostoma belcheri]
MASDNILNNSYPRCLGHTCLESGSYLMNFASCAHCNKKELIKIHNKEEREEEQEQVITYQHLCQNCDHVIAEHEYRFCVEEGYQEYQMTCLLCGSGEDSISVLPDDPRKEMDLF